jgi:predicted metal-dependent phosphoesterase TrpH
MHSVDLHCHSTYSDGLLAPAQVVQRAAANGVRMLALTDHDETGGLAEARAAALECGITLIAGVEISVSWAELTLHVVGLDIAAEDEGLRGGLAQIRAGRIERAQRIAAEFDRIGIRGSLAGARGYSANPDMLGRTHFARFLVERGIAKDVKSVFRSYLNAGKPGHVAHHWASLAQALQWIAGSGGVAVLAHPARYRLSATAMRRLLAEFKSGGGRALEVISASHTAQQQRTIAGYARQFDLQASAGSDFHGPGESYHDIGGLADLPEGCVPVWSNWANGADHAH